MHCLGNLWVHSFWRLVGNVAVYVNYNSFFGNSQQIIVIQEVLKNISRLK